MEKFIIEKKWMTFTLAIVLSSILLVLSLYEISKNVFPSYLVSILMIVLGILGLISHPQFKYIKGDDVEDNIEKINKLNFHLSQFKVLIGSIAIIIIGLILLMKQ